MDLLAEIIVIMTAAFIPIVLTAVFVFFPRADQNSEEPTYDYSGMNMYGDDTIPITLTNTVWHPDPIWYLELTNANSGLRIGKRFQKELIMGRFVGTGEQSNMLYLDRSNTISRRHVKAIVMEGGVAVENLSSVNVARLNGKALVYPDWLRYRDYLEIGDETYVVTAVSRVA